jgi:hypothetical protein
VTGHTSCGELRQALAIYVLGAIEPADREVVDRHLAACASCRDELSGFASLPGLLHRVSPQEASRLVADDTRSGHPDDAPSGQALRHLLAQASAQRRRHLRTRVAVAAAGGLLIGAAVIAASQAAHPPAPRAVVSSAPRWEVTPSATNPATGVSATVRYAAKPWGLLLSAHVTGIPVGTACQLEVISRQGQMTPAGGWIIASGRSNWYPASSPVGSADIRGFTIASGSLILITVPIRQHSPR